MNNATQETIAWATKVTEILDRTLADRISSIDDPRAKQIAAEFAINGSSDLTAYLGDEDFTLEHIWFQHFTELPPQPLEMPDWADAQKTLLGSWPEIEISFSREVTVPDVGVTIKIECIHTVFADGVGDGDGGQWSKGDVSYDNAPGMTMTVGSRGLELPFTGTGGLHVLGEAIVGFASTLDRAPAEIRRATDPGGPDQNGIGGGL